MGDEPGRRTGCYEVDAEHRRARAAASRRTGRSRWRPTAAVLWVVERGRSGSTSATTSGRARPVCDGSPVDGIPIREPIPIDDGIRAITVGGGFVWVSLWDSRTILQLDQARCRRVELVRDRPVRELPGVRCWPAVGERADAEHRLRVPPRRTARVPTESARSRRASPSLGRTVYVAIKGAGDGARARRAAIRATRPETDPGRRWVRSTSPRATAPSGSPARRRRTGAPRRGSSRTEASRARGLAGRSRRRAPARPRGRRA